MSWLDVTMYMSTTPVLSWTETDEEGNKKPKAPADPNAPKSYQFMTAEEERNHMIEHLKLNID